MSKRPIYYRWIYSPTSGDVTVSHNLEGHPAKIRFHDEMAKERSENDLQYGYAYRIVGGWHVTTDDHKPIRDPHEHQKVIDTIKRLEDGGN